MFTQPDLTCRVKRLAYMGAVHREPKLGEMEVVARMMQMLSISALIYIPETEMGECEWPMNRNDMRVL